MVDRTITLMRYCYKTGHNNTAIRKHVEKKMQEREGGGGLIVGRWEVRKKEEGVRTGG